MAKEVIIEAMPDLKKASQRRIQPTEFINEEIDIPIQLDIHIIFY